MGTSVAGGRMMGFRCFVKSCSISFKVFSWNSNSSIRLSRSRICLWRDCTLPDASAAGTLLCSTEVAGVVPHALRATATITPPARLPQIFLRQRLMVYLCHQAPHPARTFTILTECHEPLSANNSQHKKEQGDSQDPSSPILFPSCFCVGRCFFRVFLSSCRANHDNRIIP